MKRIQIIALFSLLISSAGYSQFYKDYDTDGDGKWNKDEFNSYYSEGFKDWDKNRNNKIEPTEFYRTLFDEADLNDDGYVEDTEWNDGINNLYGDYADTADFDRFNKDDDDKLDIKEWKEGFESTSWFKAYDKDGNGSLSNEELLEQLFSHFDENNNGFIDKDEYNDNEKFFSKWR